MDCNLLLAHKRIKWVLHKRTPDFRCGLLEDPVNLLHLISAANPMEVQDRFVVLQSQFRSTAYKVKNSVSLSMEVKNHRARIKDLLS